MSGEVSSADLAAANSGEGVRELVARISPNVRRWAKSKVRGPLRGGQDWEDLAQLVLTKVLRKFHLFRGTTILMFWSWVWKLAHNTWLDLLEHPSQPQVIDDLSWFSSTRASPSDSASLKEWYEIALTAIAELDPNWREIVYLRMVVGLSRDETAERVGKSPGAVSVITCRAKKQLQARLDNRGAAADGSR